MKADYYKQMETVQDEYKLVQGAAWEGAGTEQGESRTDAQKQNLYFRF